MATARSTRTGITTPRSAMHYAQCPLMGQQDASGQFDPLNGRYVPHSLVPTSDTLEAAHRDAWADQAFRAKFVVLKREKLAHTGNHTFNNTYYKFDNTLGKGLLARRMSKTTLIAEAGAGQHGVAAVAVGALLGLGHTAYMREEGTCRQALNVFRMEVLGAAGVPVTSGKRTLKDAVTQALRQWVTSGDTAHYFLGSVIGPHSHPLMVRKFQRVIREAARSQCVAGRPDLSVNEPGDYGEIAERKGSTQACSPAPQLAPADWRATAAIPTDSSGRSVSWAPPAARAPMRTRGPSPSGPGRPPTPRCSSASELTRHTAPHIAAQAARHVDSVIVASALMRHVVDGCTPGEIARTVGMIRAALDLVAA
jgi:hypothetical protein